MKTHQLTLATLLLTFFLTNNLKAQIPAIDSLKIIPTNPTTNDLVKIISHTIFPSSGCPLTSSSVNISGATITVYAAHTLGFLTAICYSKDTLTIGILNAGTYELTYHLYDTVPPTTYDIDTINFTVQQSNGLQFTDNSEQSIEIYPNPTTTEINIRLKTHLVDRYDIEIYSVLGKKIKTVREGKDTITIDISDLTDGVYFIIITSGHDRRWTQKIIKNAP